MTIIDINTENEDPFEAISVIDSMIVLLTKKPELIVYNTINEESNALNLNIDDPIISMASFAKYLYLLSSKNEIIKASGVTSGAVTTSNWIQETEKTEKFVNSLSIDGNIYVANMDGTISKYTQGKFISNFSINRITNLNSPEIFTNADLNNIYVLDKINSRIIISDKEGNLIKQIQSSLFDNLKNIFIETDSEMYILNKDKIYKFNL